MAVSSRSWPTADQVAVSVRGEIDASNAEEFARAVCEATAGCQGMTLDLSEVGFIALDAVPALHAINARLMRAGASWSITPSAAVRRLLQLCDPVGLLPVAAAEPRVAEPA
jgi:anti-anti-sigma factor